MNSYGFDRRRSASSEKACKSLGAELSARSEMSSSSSRWGTFPGGTIFPGLYIPAPVQIGSCGETDIRQRASEILALTKMNWNSSEGIGRYPITLSFAKKVGMLMAELPEDQIPNTLLPVLYVGS